MKNFKEIGVKIIATSLMAAMAMSLVACKKEAEETAGQSFTAPSAQSRTFTGIANAADAKAGDIIIFGSYEQDNDLSNGAEDIEWLVPMRLLSGNTVTLGHGLTASSMIPLSPTMRRAASHSQ